MPKLPTIHGDFRVSVYPEATLEHFVLIYGELKPSEQVLLRIHSECLTGDVFGSKRCDCGPQLQKSIEIIKAHGSGIIVYLRQEGRGIGLLNKIKAYALQDQGVDTVDANLHLGFEPDLRNYLIVVKILNDLKLKKIKLLTNNPAKIEALRSHGFEVHREAIIIPLEDSFRDYIATKQAKMGHIF